MMPAEVWGSGMKRVSDFHRIAITLSLVLFSTACGLYVGSFGREFQFRFESINGKHLAVAVRDGRFVIDDEPERVAQESASVFYSQASTILRIDQSYRRFEQAVGTCCARSLPHDLESFKRRGGTQLSLGRSIMSWANSETRIAALGYQVGMMPVLPRFHSGPSRPARHEDLLPSFNVMRA